MIHKLEADGILFKIGQRTILSDIFFKCEVGKITGILGRNGTGKSCLMNIVYGNLNVQSKSIRFNDIFMDRRLKDRIFWLICPNSILYPSLLN